MVILGTQMLTRRLGALLSFMGIGRVLTMPLFFASNAIYPISIMPGGCR
jgi:hypothetical protein